MSGSIFCWLITTAIPVAILGIPVAVVAIAWMKNRAKIKNRSVARPAFELEPPVELTVPTQIAFHQAEFVALKSEIAELIKASAANFQYAVLASAGVFAWLAGADHLRDVAATTWPDDSLVRYSALLPVLMSWLFGWMSAALYLRIGEMAGYLRKLERALGSRSLGWEKDFRGHPGTLGPIYLWGWLLLIGGDGLVALILLTSRVR